MPDREKVIEIFSELRNFADNDVHPVVSPENWPVYSKLRDLIDQAEEDTLALLKEQETYSEHELVRCGYCKHNTSSIHNPICELDAYRSGGVDWFCADGERRTDDA